MKLATMRMPFLLDNVCLFPHTTYLIPNQHGDWPEEVASVQEVYGELRPVCGQDLDRKRVMVCRYGALGDALMATGVIRYLQRSYPEATFHIYVPPMAAQMWGNLGWCVLVGFPTLESVRAYDYHLCIDDLFCTNGLQDQGNVYDEMFRALGLLEAVPEEAKRPFVVPHGGDMQELMGLGAYPLPEKLLCYHVRPSTDVRQWPEASGEAFLMNFLREHPDWCAVVAGNGERPFHVPNSRCINLYNQLKSPRSCVEIVRSSSLVVAADSAFVHLAAALEKPCVGLWGPFSYESRAKYYPKHYDVRHEQNHMVCPHAPCFTHGYRLPLQKCKDAPEMEGHPIYCAEMKAISVKLVLEMVEAVIQEEEL